MSPFWAAVLIGWLPAIPALVAYAMTGRRVWRAALALAALGAGGWAAYAVWDLGFGWYVAALAALAAPGVAGAGLADDLAEELTVAGWVYVLVSASLAVFYFAFRDEGMF